MIVSALHQLSVTMTQQHYVTIHHMNVTRGNSCTNSTTINTYLKSSLIYEI